MKSPLLRFENRLAKLKSTSQHRFLEPHSSPQGPEITLNDARYINFCNNDYLGLSNHPEIRGAAIEGIKRFGVGAGAAPLLSGYSESHFNLETRLATMLGFERALLFSSGYLANLGVIAGLTEREDKIFLDRLDHASIIDGARLSGAKFQRFGHNDPASLQKLLESRGQNFSLVATEGVFSMDGDLSPLPALALLAKQHSAILMCDDAHGFGIMGDGRGTMTHYRLNANDVPILVITFGKALGTVGAAILSSNSIIELLVNFARTFVYDTALPPAMAFATLAALKLSDEHEFRDKLFKNISLFQDGLRNLEIPILSALTPIQPIIIGDSNATLRVAAKLRELGIYVRAVRPSTVPIGTARLRICISAAHSENHLLQLLDALRIVRKWF